MSDYQNLISQKHEIFTQTVSILSNMTTNHYRNFVIRFLQKYKIKLSENLKNMIKIF